MKKWIIASVVVLAMSVFGAYFYEDTEAKRKFIKQEHFRDHINLQVYVFKNEKEMRKAIKKRFPKQKDLNHIIGFSVWNNINNRCEIFITEANRESDFETWGHELAHCMYGRWHK